MTTDHSPHADWIRSAVQRYEGPLIRYAAQIVGDLERARDVVQDTFIRLCADEQSLVETHLAEWLFTVCRHRALDIQRKESRMQPINEEEMRTYASQEPTPAMAAEHRETARQVLRLLEMLPPNQQEVIRLKFQNELSYQEISNVTRLTVTNVGFLIHTAIKTIRQQLRAQSALIPQPVRRTQ